MATYRSEEIQRYSGVIDQQTTDIASNIDSIMKNCEDIQGYVHTDGSESSTQLENSWGSLNEVFGVLKAVVSENGTNLKIALDEFAQKLIREENAASDELAGTVSGIEAVNDLLSGLIGPIE